MLRSLKFVFVLSFFAISALLFIPKSTNAVFCQCCRDGDESSCISCNGDGSKQGTCCTPGGLGCGSDSDPSDGNTLPDQISCGAGYHVTGCGGGGGDGGDGGSGGGVPIIKECWDTCTASTQCRQPLTCGVASDNKLRCIFPGAPTDQTCKQLPVCSSTCNTTDACGSAAHVVKLVNKPLASNKNVMAFDGVIEDTAIYEQNTTRFTYSPGWAAINFPNFRYSGGSFSFSSKAGDWVSFSSSSKKLKVMSSTSFTAGQIEVYVDGVLVKTENRTPPSGALEGSYSAPFEVVLEPEDNGYMCYTDTSVTPNKKYCRLSDNPTDATCSSASFQCKGVTKTPANPMVGDKVSYTMNPVDAALISGTNITYQGKCDVSSGTTITNSFNLTPVSAQSNVFQSFVVAKANTKYSCVFRYCYIANVTNSLTCSPWGQAQ